ncbi:hypothetical protein Lal_00029675 [Lupinus albus]|uniref:Uncharacterized protein n=1 Tax=Lupinus albus TaxID=3870 RepID=A0A6A4QA95_LUPAL|nr:hypothetical protein Lalb_Chr07g0187611 [Lupinus albus]KAF1876327.1 hypothetical protein Lal_00029675 [Lupinus albus]
MAPSVSRSTSGFSFSEHWLLLAAIALIFAFLGYIVYHAIMATASELLQRLLLISPLLLIIIVHWLSTGTHLRFPMPGSEPSAIHTAGGSPWGVAFVLLLLFFFISYQPSLHNLIS